MAEIKVKIDELETIRQRINKALTRLDSALETKILNDGLQREKQDQNTQEKLQRVIAEKDNQSDEMKKTNTLLEEEIVRLNEKLHKERSKNERLKKFGNDVNTRIETIVQQLELMSE